MADLTNMQPDEYKLLRMNFASGRPWGIACVVWHHMAGDLDADACNRVWLGAGNSAHYSVDSDGYIVQHVRDMDRAYACGDGIGRGSLGNDRGVSIEFANDMSSRWRVHEASLEAGAHLTAALCRFYGLGRPEWMANVFPHSHFAATACPGELAGSQNAHAMERARHWYDVMTGAKPEEKPEPAPKPSGLDLGDTSWFGKKMCSELQRQLGCPVIDGEISGQSPYNAETVQWAIQVSPPDPSCSGSVMVIRLQRFLIAKGYSVGASGADGNMGHDTVSALQRFLLGNGISVGAAGIDGYFGNGTSRAVGVALERRLFRG